MTKTLSVCATLCCLTACNSGGTFPDSSSTDPDSARPDDGDPTGKTVEETVDDALRAVAVAVHSVAPMSDLARATSGGTGLPSCPAVSGSAQSNQVELTLSYGSGCVPRQLRETRISGSLAGKTLGSMATFQYNTSGLQAGSVRVTGDVGGSVDTSQPEPRLATSVALTEAGGLAIRGQITASIDAAGTLRISTGNLMITTPPGDRVAATLDGVVMLESSGTAFRYAHGKVEAEVVTDSAASSTQTIER